MKKAKLVLGAFLLSSLAGFTVSAHAGGDAAAGEAVWKKVNCASCHGADAKSPIDPTYPKLAGQYHDYIEVALHEYQRGQQPKAPAAAAVRKNAIMGAMAMQLSQQDIKDVAAYLSGLPSELSTAK